MNRWKRESTRFVGAESRGHRRHCSSRVRQTRKVVVSQSNSDRRNCRRRERSVDSFIRRESFVPHAVTAKAPATGASNVYQTSGTDVIGAHRHTGSGRSQQIAVPNPETAGSRLRTSNAVRWTESRTRCAQETAQRRRPLIHRAREIVTTRPPREMKTPVCQLPQ